MPTDPAQGAEEVETLLAEQVRAVRAAVSVPVAAKLGSHLTAPAHFARRLERAGADGLVLFNRFLEPDIELETLAVVPHLELSHPSEMRLALRWVAILSAHCALSLGATGGAHTALDALKLILAGADAVMLTSVLLRHGPAHLTGMLDELRRWLAEHDCESVEQVKASVNHRNCADPGGYERLNYMRALLSFSG